MTVLSKLGEKFNTYVEQRNYRLENGLLYYQHNQVSSLGSDSEITTHSARAQQNPVMWPNPHQHFCNKSANGLFVHSLYLLSEIATPPTGLLKTSVRIWYFFPSSLLGPDSGRDFPRTIRVEQVLKRVALNAVASVTRYARS